MGKRLGQVLLCMSVLAAGLPGGSMPAGASVTREVVLGQSASFSGSWAAQATSYRDGALAYLNWVNSNGGVYGMKIRLISLDDGYKVDRAVENTRKLIEEEKVDALFNYTWTNTVRATIPIAIQAKVPYFGPYTGYDELYTSHSPYVFTTRASFSEELAKIIVHLKTIGLTRIGLLYYDSPSGRELRAETTRMLADVGLRLHAEGKMKPTTKDASPAVAALREADMQALILGASGSDAVAFIRQFEEVRKGRTQYYARSLIGIKQLVEELGPLAGGVSVSQTAPNPFRSRAQVAVDYRRLLARLDPRLKPDYIGLEGFISAKVMVEALRKAGPQPSRQTLARALTGMGRVDVGGYAVRFAPGRHHGSHFVELTLIGRDGRVVD
ncbi:ABC transporter substrate-binding protein [Aquabacterium sp. A7-Y]|uniref:ABC transporter substrate-binding protein n=1 Tax=Aquabacterium sp. A7-Y TaxID=1349605 RepID=UPI00223D149D|nr:ABC transporter substrate-binding protein [Aquabacterium sp. A7-Y]MCW7538607.1 ABC transporter substrate-binding protein [Aquabacterium sp. A7-Y]